MGSNQKRRNNGQFAPMNRGIKALPKDAPPRPVNVAERHAREEAATIGYLALAWGFRKEDITLGKRRALQQPGFFEGQLKINGVDLIARRMMYVPVAPNKEYRFEVVLHRPGLFGKKLTDSEVAALVHRSDATVSSVPVQPQNSHALAA